jgi:hypothetical protein
MEAQIRHTIEEPWLSMEPVRVGDVPQWLSTPERFITVEDNKIPIMRIDVYAYPVEEQSLEDARIWKEFVIICYRQMLHLISIKGRTFHSTDLEGYIDHIYPLDDYLLVASRDRVFRFASDGKLTWKSKKIAEDGVIIKNPGPEKIIGEAAWESDPEVWDEFQLDPLTGEVIRGDYVQFEFEIDEDGHAHLK